MRWMRIPATAVIASLVVVATWQTWVSADGTETLGEPSVDIADGTGIALAGVGLFEQPGLLTVEVPENATIEQALLYWEGSHDTLVTTSDDTIVLNGNRQVGDLIGGPAIIFGTTASTTHRVDITDLGLIGPGVSTIEVSGLNENTTDDGAGLFVIYSEPGLPFRSFQVRDGNDFAYWRNPGARAVTVPQTFTFPASNVDRTALAGFLVGSVEDGQPRPQAVDVTVGDTTTRYTNPFNNVDGREFDHAELEIDIPADVTSVTIEVVSARDDTNNEPASLVWIAAGFALNDFAQPLPTPTPEPSSTVEPTPIPTIVPTPTATPIPTAPPSGGPPQPTAVPTITPDVLPTVVVRQVPEFAG